MSEKKTVGLITDLLIEELDFDPEFPCEFPTHDVHHSRNEKAKWKISGHCPHCHYASVNLACDEGIQELNGYPFMRCLECGVITPSAQIITIEPI